MNERKANETHHQRQADLNRTGTAQDERVAEVMAEHLERQREQIDKADFIKAALVMLELWSRHQASSGITALFCLCWAIQPDRFTFPLTRLGALDGELSLAWCKLTNGLMLGHGDYVWALRNHLGEETCAELLIAANAELFELEGNG